MDSRANTLHEESRLAGVIRDVEADLLVDIKKIGTLQALDLAEIGRSALADALDRENEADEQARQIFGD